MDMNNLELLIGRVVRIDRGGPESRYGNVIAVKPDHIALHIENEGVAYYKIDHIKSISVDTKENADLLVSANKKAPAVTNVIDAASFQEVMGQMKYRWVQINRGGPEKVEGVLVEVSEESALLVANNEIINILPFHIRNISYGIKKTQQDNSAQNDKDSGKDNDQQQSKAAQEQKNDKKEKQSKEKKEGYPYKVVS